MRTVCILDSSVLDEVLAVPGKSGEHTTAADDLLQKAKNGELLVLAWPVLVEVGGHIAHCRDGTGRRKLAEAFAELVKKALEGRGPLSVAELPKSPEISRALDSFADAAMRGLSLADLVLGQLYERYCEEMPYARIYVWSFDRHLSGFDRPRTKV
jgi:hypothetical protein